MGRAKKPFRAPEDIKFIWDDLKRTFSIGGKPDMSHVTEGICRVWGLSLNVKADRAKLTDAIRRFSSSWGDEPVTAHTARNWIAGSWTEDAAAVAVCLSAARLGRNGTDTAIKEEVELRTRFLDMDWQKQEATLRTVFELFIFGKLEGGERAELLASVLVKVCKLDSAELSALDAFLNAFWMGGIPSQPPNCDPAGMVSEISRAVEQLEYWADEKEGTRPETAPEKKPSPLHFI